MQAQTDQTAPPKEQSDLGLHGLPFYLIFWAHKCFEKSLSSMFRTIVLIILGVPGFRIMTINQLNYKNNIEI